MESGEGTSTSAKTLRILHYHPPPHYTEPSDHTSDPTNSNTSAIQNDTDQSFVTPPSAGVSPPAIPQQVLCSSTASTSNGSNVLVLTMPSPPSSPGSNDSSYVSPSPSDSSLPESVSSSFFFSSSPAGLSSDEYEQRQRSSVRRPTPFGQTLGVLRLLVVGQGTGNLTSVLLEDNEDVVHVGSWEGSDKGKSRVLRASTDWRRGVPLRNVEIMALEGDLDPTAIIEQPFRALDDVLQPDAGSSDVVNNLLAAPNSGLWTVMVFLMDGLVPTPLDNEIICSLAAHIPLIVLSKLSAPTDPDPSLHPSPTLDPNLSSFAPRTALALRAGLFRSPKTLALLRQEAADRFMRWREVHRSLLFEDGQQRLLECDDDARRDQDMTMVDHSRLVALVGRRMRESTVTVRAGTSVSMDEDDASYEKSPAQTQFPAYTPFDPLHLPSLLVLSLSLFVPLKERVACAMGRLGVQLAWVGGFCVGVGVGFCVATW